MEATSETVQGARRTGRTAHPVRRPIVPSVGPACKPGSVGAEAPDDHFSRRTVARTL